MPAVVEVDFGPRLLFTAPWEPLVVRRGDALGLRALTDEFADAVAPDLSNRVHDGRWVTILAWCLARSDEVFHASGGCSVATRDEQRRRYAWLRPLELMWVARTIALADDEGQNRSLAGQRRVRPWCEAGKRRTPPFGMTEDQFRRYRQTGMYGGYRLAFRRWPGMTVAGDGWTPGSATTRLAKWLDARLGEARPPWLLHADDGDESRVPKPDNRSLGKEHEWWLRQWETFAEGGRSADKNTLPRRRDDFTVLPEHRLLTPPLFGDDRNGKRRLDTAREVEKSSARDHIAACEHLGRAFAGDPTFALLPRFSRLADAGMEAMHLITTALQNNSWVRLADVVAHPKAALVCDKLRTAARMWLERPSGPLRHIGAADRLARAIQEARPIDTLRALLRHHATDGGGVRWFALRDDRIEMGTPWRGGSSLYRFRLWSLCRLAAQCGAIRGMPIALRESAEAEADDPGEATDE